MKRAIVDANVVISGTIAPHGAPAAILNAWRADSFEVVVCPALLAEIAEKLRLPRIRDKYHISEEDVLRLLARFSQAAILVPGQASIKPPPPDPDDTMLFSAAVEATADFIVTGDKALLSFAWGGPGNVVSPRQFWLEELRSGAGAG
ncbi:MAG TPA: putative toxin-antitoxin system toxin component, PIN family [Gemmataceae bacterium]|nr:putative toxin-antitoxin system toxin component, PIN family [Gemmataceae bacterium]